VDVSAIIRHQLARPVPRRRPAEFGSVVEVLAWLPREDDAGNAVDWTFPDARRLLFALWLAEHGRLKP
jgi:hypothetical protein